MPDVISALPHVNASLNALATVLLVTGLVCIKQGHETAHKRTMISCFLVSTVFFVCYVAYHAAAGSRRFPDYPPAGVRYSYLAILATHVVLAMAVPPLAICTIVAGLRDRRSLHRKLARWAFPIWIYVSLSGVVVYMMLYQLFPPHDLVTIITGLTE